MVTTRMILNLTVAGLAAAATHAVAPPASAQTTDMSTTSTTTSTTATRRPRAAATPEMIAEAIQRSQARTQRAQQLGRQERFGSEEPFTYDPTR